MNTINTVEKTKLLTTLECLDQRMQLSNNQKRVLKHESLGFMGEKYFADMLEKHLIVSPIKIFDYRFEVDGNERQIDCLLIFENEIIIIEVKNYTGEFVLENKMMSFLKGRQLDSQPLFQLQTTKAKFENHLRLLGKNFRVSGFIVFTNKEFYLYNVSLNDPLIFHSTFNKLFNLLNQKYCNIQGYHEDFARLLLKNKVKHSQYEKEIEYEFDNLNKGIYCEQCKIRKMIRLSNNSRKYVKCTHCNHLEIVDHALLRSIKDFYHLFPEKRITVTNIYLWVNKLISEKKISRVLQKYFVQRGITRNRHYVYPNEHE